VPNGSDRALGRPHWVAAVGIGISVVALVAVVLWASRQPAPQLPSGGEELAAVGLALLLIAITTGLRSERWRALALQSGGRVTRGESYGITVVGFMGNTVLPARGGDALRVVLAGPRAELPARQAIGTLLAERLLDVLTLLGAFVVLAYGVLRGIDTPDGAPLALLGGALLLAAAAGALLWWARGRHEWARRLVDFIAPMGRATRDLVSRHGVLMLTLTVAIWVLETGVWLAASWASGLDLAPIEALYLVALAAIFVLIPSGPGYAGTLDAGVLFGVGALGVGGSTALSYLLVLRFLLFVPLTVAGGMLVLLRYGGPAMLRRAGEGSRA
jgi:glycosyltransferase 2 family protein